jgi:beta-glucanase (GH16 family)
LLDITARNDSIISNGHVYPITSARIKTQGIKDWTYGRMEIRAKIPSSLGTWPAIWTLAAILTRLAGPPAGN